MVMVMVMVVVVVVAASVGWPEVTVGRGRRAGG
jgi:hypothetical protein